MTGKILLTLWLLGLLAVVHVAAYWTLFKFIPDVAIGFAITESIVGMAVMTIFCVAYISDIWGKR